MQKMTEKEAINVMEKYTDIALSKVVIEAHNMAIAALEEIQQYRAIGTVEDIKALSSMEIANFNALQKYREIGTVEDLKTMKENGAFTGVELAQIAAMQMKLKEYQSIGTVEECRKAVRFKKYFDELYGESLEVANWHKNGDLEPFDSFYESALDWSE